MRERSRFQPDKRELSAETEYTLYVATTSRCFGCSKRWLRWFEEMVRIALENARDRVRSTPFSLLRVLIRIGAFGFFGAIQTRELSGADLVPIMKTTPFYTANCTVSAVFVQTP